MKRFFISLVVGSSVLSGSLALAEDSQKSGAPLVAPDNTEKNAERESANLKTAGDAGNSAGEIKMAADIRQALVHQKKLSSYAKNIKVIVNGNNVHLAGPVRSTAEKAEVERLARVVASGANITNETQVAPQSK